MAVQVTGIRSNSSDLPQGSLEIALYLRSLEMHHDKVEKLLYSTGEESVDKTKDASTKGEVLDTENKKIKLDDGASPWILIEGVFLNDDDKTLILEGSELNDKYMDGCYSTYPTQTAPFYQGPTVNFET